MKLYLFLLYFSVLCLTTIFVACEVASNPDGETTSTISCGNTQLANAVSYNLEVQGVWTPTNFGDSLIPPGAHFSPFVIFSHTADAYIFKVGEMASPDLETLAETGGTAIRNITNTDK